MLSQQTIPSIPMSVASISRPQFTMPQFLSPSFPSNVATRDFLSQRNSPIQQTQTINDLVNQTLAQMTLSTYVPNGGWDFLQHNTLIESCACVLVPNYFTHLKLETYDGSSNPTQHMLRFTSQMYVDNATYSICCCMLPSSLTGKALAWYAHLPSRSVTWFNALRERFIRNFLSQSIFQPTSDFLLSVRQCPPESVRDFTARFNQIA